MKILRSPSLIFFSASWNSSSLDIVIMSSSLSICKQKVTLKNIVIALFSFKYKSNFYLFFQWGTFLKKKCNGLIWGKIVRKLIACFVSLTFPLEQHFSVSLVKQLRNLLLQITKVRIVSKRHSSHLWLYGWHQGYFHFHHGLSHVFLFTNKSDFSVRTL